MATYPNPFGLPAAFLGPISAPPPIESHGFGAFLSQPPVTLTGKRHQDSPPEASVAFSVKKRAEGPGIVHATRWEGALPYATAIQPVVQFMRQAPPPPIAVPAPDAPLGAARSAAGLSFRSSPAFDCPLASPGGNASSAGSGNAHGSPCPVCGEGYCLRSPCIAVGRAGAAAAALLADYSMAAPGGGNVTGQGAGDASRPMQQSSGQCAGGSGSAGGSDDDSDDAGGSSSPARLRIVGPAAALLEAYPWRTVLPPPPLPGAAAAEAYAIIPYAPPLHASPAAPQPPPLAAIGGGSVGRPSLLSSGGVGQMPGAAAQAAGRPGGSTSGAAMEDEDM